MIGVFRGEARIGSMLKFPHQKLPWCAYAMDGTRQSFKTKREAMSWLGQRYDLMTQSKCA